MDKLQSTVAAQIIVNVDIKYLVQLPQGYNRSDERLWPLVLFLHGAGERGDDLSLVEKHGPPKLASQGKEFPFLLVSPQCPNRTSWPDLRDALAKLVDELIYEYPIDPTRIYVTGLSMGGYGTWYLAQAYPKRFAAIAPICGGGDPSKAALIKDIPTWVFHGAKDEVVPISQSQDMVDALKALGSGIRFTIYPEANHDAWSETYENPEFYEWLLSHRRK